MRYDTTIYNCGIALGGVAHGDWIASPTAIYRVAIEQSASDFVTPIEDAAPQEPINLTCDTYLFDGEHWVLQGLTTQELVDLADTA